MTNAKQEKNIKITKIVFGIIQLVINLFKNKHGRVPESLEEFQNEAQELRGEA